MAGSTNNASFPGGSNSGYQFGQVLNSTINVGESSDTDETKFLRSLSSDYRRWKDNNPKRVSGTCEWLLNDPRFVQWQAAEQSCLLHVLAGPGCGKSVLARSVIDENLAARAEKQALTLYFFFKRGEEAQETGTTAIKAMMHQFYQATSGAGLKRYAVPKYLAHGDTIGNMFAELWDILLLSTKEVSEKDIICVIDALDECKKADRYILMAAISEYISQSTDDLQLKPVKFMVTSRPYPDTEFNDSEFLRNHSFIRFDGTDKSTTISEEINHVIAIKVPALFPKLSPSTKEAIVKQLQSMNNRTYLWLYLVLDYVKQHIVLHSTEKRLRSLLRQLPPSMDQAYNVMLERSSDPDLTMTLLSITLAAKKPLTLEEASFALELSRNSHDFVDSIDYFPAEQFADLLKESCGLLLTVHESKIYFLHETVREFLLNANEIPLGSVSTWKGSINLDSANILMANLCMARLLLSASEPIASILFQIKSVGSSRTKIYNGTPEQVREWAKQSPFLIYAACNWIEHSCAVEIHLTSKLKSCQWQLYDDTSIAFGVWSAVKQAMRTTYFNRINCISGLPIFTRAGLCTVVKHLLNSGADTEKATDMGTTALHMACGNDSMEMIRMLCEHGAHVESRDKFGNTPLSIVSAAGHEQAAVTLLEYGANVNAVVDLRPHIYSALMLACEKRNVQIVQLLLQHGADVNRRADSENCALHIACRVSQKSLHTFFGHEGMIQFRCDRADTPLDPSEVIVRLLLERGAVIDVQDLYGQTPLYYASSAGNEQIVRVLLEHGADKNLQDLYGQTPLHLAAVNGNRLAVQVLLEYGAEIGTWTNSGETPLDHALRDTSDHERREIVKMLTDHGATTGSR